MVIIEVDEGLSDVRFVEGFKVTCGESIVKRFGI
jgi:hypothetical protein